MKNLIIFLFSLTLLACEVQQPVVEAPTKPTIMPTFSLEEATIEQLHKGYQNKDFTIQEITQKYLDRIETIDKNGPSINSVMQINPDALSIAKQLDEELKAGRSRGPMHGIPVLLKDNIDTHDRMFTTAGSRALQGLSLIHI